MLRVRTSLLVLAALLAPTALTLIVAPAAHSAVVSSVFGGRLPCQQAGIGQVCSSVGIVNRVETWDGVPLDVTVTIPPPQMNGPFPLIVALHGFAAGKTPDEIQELVPNGYVVIIYSARGQHFSCGFVASRQTDPTLADPDACMHRGWFRLGDARYEVRDTQYLAGRLVDEGLVLPNIGVTGISFGGGQTMMLAALRNRMMLPDGSLVPWKSPGGVDMSVAVAAPLIGWSDLAYALVPNGRTLDYRAFNPYFQLGVSERAGVMKQSWVDGLYDAGIPTAFYAPPGADPDADLAAWKARLDAGEPYDDDPLLHHAVTELTTHHSAYYIDDSVEPPPLFIYDAFTDDIMPFDEALRYYRKTKSLYPAAEVALQSLDGFAHPRGNLGSPMRPTTYNRVLQHLQYHLKGVGGPVPAVETYTQACGGSAQAGPFTATDWDAIHPGEVRYTDAAAKTFDSAAGSAVNAIADDPISDPNDPLGSASTSCRTVPTSDDDPAAATYRLPAVASGCTYTLMGSPTVIADLSVSGEFSEIAARLWDVAPDGTQSLVTHGLYRPRNDDLGPQVFQLHPNGWQFTAGHVAKFELLGQSSPYGRASNGTFAITASDVDLRLPVLETQGTCGVSSPAPLVFPPSDPEVAPTIAPTPIPTGTTVSATATPISPTATPTPQPPTILGNKLDIQNRRGPAERKVRGGAREKASPDAIVGDPTAAGATLRVFANGGTPSDQTFDLPATGWSRTGSAGFKYNRAGLSGVVKRASIKKTRGGTFQIKILLDGKGGALNVVPPSPGDDGGFILALAGGEAYCSGFGGAARGTEARDDPTRWLVKKPLAEWCPVP